MRVARHGRGPRAAFGALASQVHPVFMLPPVATSWFGSTLAGRFSVTLGTVHVLAVFFGVYVAHLRDGYVDFYVRGEDDDHPLTPAGYRLALAGATTGFIVCVVALWWLVGLGAVLLTLPGWFIGYLHAPQLDTNPVTTTTGYPLGIALALVGGYYVQTGRVDPLPLAFATVFLVILSGVKVIDDSTDYAYDRSIDKRTVAVVLGTERARRVAYGLMAAGMVGVVLLAIAGVFPTGSVAAALAFGLVAGISVRADARLATMLLVRGAYVFLAVLLVAVSLRPLG